MFIFIYIKKKCTKIVINFFVFKSLSITIFFVKGISVDNLFHLSNILLKNSISDYTIDIDKKKNYNQS